MAHTEKKEMEYVKMNTFVKDAIIAYHSFDNGGNHDVRIGYRVFSVWTMFQAIFFFGTVKKAMLLLQARHCFGMVHNRSLYLVFEY